MAGFGARLARHNSPDSHYREDRALFSAKSPRIPVGYLLFDEFSPIGDLHCLKHFRISGFMLSMQNVFTKRRLEEHGLLRHEPYLFVKPPWVEGYNIAPVHQNDALHRIGEAFDQLPACRLSTPFVADKGESGNCPLTGSVVALLIALIELREISMGSWNSIALLINGTIEVPATRLDGLIPLRAVISHSPFLVLPGQFWTLFRDNFLVNFHDSRSRDKLEMAAIIANILSDVDDRGVEEVLQEPRFIEIIEICLAMDSEPNIETLLNGLHEGLRLASRRVDPQVRERL
jgi:hypothetical protein